MRDEFGKLIRAVPDIGLVEHAFRQPAEEPGHAAFQDLATGRQQRRTGRYVVPERQQVVLIAAGPVKQKQRRPGWSRWLEPVDERQVSVGHITCQSGGA